MKKILVLTICTIFFACNICTLAHATETRLKIDTVLCAPGKTVDVPIIISNNSGIAGAVIKISYDDRLELTAVKEGESFSSLTYTPPAKLTSNPITLLWDGIENDTSNGTIAVLTFAVPDDANENYQICATYDIGGIYDEALNDTDVTVENGSVNVSDTTCIQASVTDTINVKLISQEEIEGTVYVALYGSNNALIEIKSYPAKESILPSLDNINSGAYIKVFWWEALTLRPYCEEATINLK